MGPATLSVVNPPFATVPTASPSSTVELSRRECLELLEQCGHGRVTVTISALPAIVPVHFAVLDEEIVFTPRSGFAIDAALDGAVVAFEADRVDPEWTVMAVGRAQPLTDERLAHRAAGALTPWAATGGPFWRLERMTFTGRAGRP